MKRADPTPVDPADELYVVPPDAFVAARTALSKRLVAAGDAAGAKAVKKMRRPSVAAWALNRVARDRADDVAKLAATARELRAAQRRALSGSGGAALKQAASSRSALVQRLTVAAAAVLEESGRDPAPHRQAITSTLLAASSDPELADELSRGRLIGELQPPDALEGLLGASVAVDDRRDRARGRAADEEAPPARVLDLDAHRARRAARDDADEAPRAPAPAKKTDARARIAEARRRAEAEERARIAEEKRLAKERAAEEKRRAAEEKKRRDEEKKRARAALEDAEARLVEALAAVTALDDEIAALEAKRTDARKEAKAAELEVARAKQHLRRVDV